jgi:lysine-specific demethylase 8
MTLPQVHGIKYVRLHPPDQAAALYPYDQNSNSSSQQQQQQQQSTHNMMVRGNTSQVDCRAVDASQFPEYGKQPYFEALLQEGDSLYIPDRWWHFCEASGGGTSFSVNHWWL